MKRILPSLKAAKDDEIINFCMRCSAMKLNPFLDVHNVTFGDNEILVPIVKKDYYIQNAHKNQDYKGFSAGIVVTLLKFLCIPNINCCASFRVNN